MESPALRDLQESFLAFVAGPPVAREDGRSQLARQVVRSAGPLVAEERLQIYRAMGFARLIEVLRDDFADVAARLGDEGFDTCARLYLTRHPSQRPTIQHVSERFPEFLEQEFPEAPHLGERAAIARARLHVFSEMDPDSLTLDHLRDRPPESWGEVPLVPIQAMRLVTRAWADDGRPKAQLVRIWRQGFEIFQASVDPLEASGLDLLADGDADLNALGSLLERELPADDAAREAGALLLRWIEDGILDAAPVAQNRR